MKKIITFLVLCIILSTISSCSAQTDEGQLKVDEGIEEHADESSALESEAVAVIPEREYSEIEYVHSEDPGTNGFVRKMDTVVEGVISFFFEQSIDTNVRETCIKQTISFLPLLDTEEPFTIYLFEPETMVDAEIRSNAVYTHVQAFDSPDYLTQLLLARYGEYCLYGLTYGYACYLLGIPATNEAKYSTDDPVLDLNLLCFNDRFMDNNQIENCKAIAGELVVWLIEKEGENTFRTILQDSGQLEQLDKTCAILKDFYQTKGVDFEPLPAMLRYGGYSFDYVLQTNEGQFYIDKRFEDLSFTSDDYPLNPTIYDGFLHKNYSDIRVFFFSNLEQIRILRTHFGHDVITSDIPIMFDNSAGKAGGVTKLNHEPSQIHLNMVESLLHEFIHVLSYRSMNNNITKEIWAKEGYARYYEALLPNAYRDPFHELLFQVNMEEKRDGIEQFNQQYLSITGKDTYIVQRDMDLFDALTVFYDYSKNDNYDSGASFCKYLIEKYGEDALNKFMYPKEGEEQFDYSIFGGKTEDELVTDWKTEIEANWVSLVTYKEWKQLNQ